MSPTPEQSDSPTGPGNPRGPAGPDAPAPPGGPLRSDAPAGSTSPGGPEQSDPHRDDPDAGADTGAAPADSDGGSASGADPAQDGDGASYPAPDGEIHARTQTEQANEELQEENAASALDQPSDGSGGE